MNSFAWRRQRQFPQFSGTLAVVAVIAALIGASPAHAQFTVTVNINGVGLGYVDSGPTGSPPMNCQADDGERKGTCTATYNPGTVVTLVARPAPNVEAIWSRPPCGGSGVDCVVSMTQNHSVTLEFRPITSFQLTVNVSGNGFGRVTQLDLRGQPRFNCSLQGTNQTVTCTASYPATTHAWLEKTASLQAASVGSFSGACSGDPCKFRMDDDKVVNVTFVSPAVTVQSGGGSGTGTVTANGGISCAITPGSATGACSATYPSPSQQTVTLHAQPNSGSKFVGWTVSDRTCSGIGDCVINPPAFGLPGTVVSARFDVDQNSITVNGTGSGSVKSTPNGIDCTLTINVPSAGCDSPFGPGASVTLTATPANGWEFASWGDACASFTTNVCQLQMTQSHSVRVNFKRTLVTLTVSGSGTGDGKVRSSSPADIIDCDVQGTNVTGKCTAQVEFETSVTLTAAAAEHSTFESWSAASCPGTGPCTVKMAGPQTVTATFRGTRVAVNIGGTGTGDGLITAPDGMSCRITKGVASSIGCTTSAVRGSSVVLTAVPQNGSVFAAWSLASCAASSLTCAVTLNQPTSVSAGFTAPPAATQLIDALINGTGLSAAFMTELDKFGNNDGTFNLGDLIALLDRTQESISPAALARVMELEGSRPSSRRGAP